MCLLFHVANPIAFMIMRELAFCSAHDMSCIRHAMWPGLRFSGSCRPSLFSSSSELFPILPCASIASGTTSMLLYFLLFTISSNLAAAPGFWRILLRWQLGSPRWRLSCRKRLFLRIRPLRQCPAVVHRCLLLPLGRPVLSLRSRILGLPVDSPRLRPGVSRVSRLLLLPLGIRWCGVPSRQASRRIGPGLGFCVRICLGMLGC